MLPKKHQAVFLAYVFEAHFKQLFDFVGFSGNSHRELVGSTSEERFVKLNVKGCCIDFSVTKQLFDM